MSKPQNNAAAGNELLHRMAEINRESLVFKALHKCEPGNKRGNVSKCWKLDYYTRHQAAMMHIDGQMSAEKIHDELADRMVIHRAKGKDEPVSARVLSTWLRTIRTEFGKLYDTQLGEIIESEATAYQSGDMLALMGITIAGIVPKFLQYLKQMDMAAMSVAEHHIWLRLLDIQTNAAKVQAEVGERQARTNNINAKLREAVGVVDDENKLTPEERVKIVSGLIREAMGLGSAA